MCVNMHYDQVQRVLQAIAQAALAAELAASRRSRDTRIRAMVELMAQDGYPVSY